MNSRTKLILVLIFFVGLFGAVLLFDVIKTESSDAEALERSAESAAFRVMAAFAPKLELRGLRCNNQRVSRPFTLTESSNTCSVRIPRDRDNEIRKAELTATGNGLVVYLRAIFDGEKFPERERDRDTCIQDEARLAPFRLQIEHLPEADVEERWECWMLQDPDESIPVVAFEDGGSLELECNGCEAESRAVRLRMQ